MGYFDLNGEFSWNGQDVTAIVIAGTVTTIKSGEGYYAAKGLEALGQAYAGQVFGTVIGDITVLKNTYQRKDSDDYDQGGEDFEIILGWNGRFFRLHGHADSYGERTFTGEVTEAHGKTKTITVWE